MKFRGLRENKTWVYGYYYTWKRYGKEIPIVGEGVQNGSVNGDEVIPETVGMFTGKYDIDGVEIYQGDILSVDNEETYIVEWGEEEAGFYIFQEATARTFYFPDLEGLKVVGNIYVATCA